MMPDLLTRLSDETLGRDKVFRLLQYWSKLAWWGVEKSVSVDSSACRNLKNVESHLSMARKLLRLGRSLQFLQSALSSLHHTDPVSRVTLTLSRIASALYLFVDHWIWVSRVVLQRSAASCHELNLLSARFWLLSIVCNLVRDFYEMIRTVDVALGARRTQKRRHHRYNQNDNDVTADCSKLPPAPASQDCFQALVSRRPLLLDTLKNAGDLLLPMSTLSYVHLSPGSQGCVGMMTSAISIYVMSNPALKM